LQIIFIFKIWMCQSAQTGQRLLVFAGTDQNSQLGQDASRRYARRSDGPDRDANYVLPSTQTDQDEPFTTPVYVDPAGDALTHRVEWLVSSW
jgi:hypothetical protein